MTNNQHTTKVESNDTIVSQDHVSSDNTTSEEVQQQQHDDDSDQQSSTTSASHTQDDDTQDVGVDGAPLSKKPKRQKDKLQHSRNETRRRLRIRQQFDRLRDVIRCDKKDRFSILQAAINCVQAYQQRMGIVNVSSNKRKKGYVSPSSHAGRPTLASAVFSSSAAPPASVDSADDDSDSPQHTRVTRAQAAENKGANAQRYAEIKSESCDAPLNSPHPNTSATILASLAHVASGSAMTTDGPYTSTHTNGNTQLTHNSGQRTQAFLIPAPPVSSYVTHPLPVPMSHPHPQRSPPNQPHHLKAQGNAPLNNAGPNSTFTSPTSVVAHIYAPPFPPTNTNTYYTTSMPMLVQFPPNNHHHSNNNSTANQTNSAMAGANSTVLNNGSSNGMPVLMQFQYSNGSPQLMSNLNGGQLMPAFNAQQQQPFFMHNNMYSSGMQLSSAAPVINQ